MAKKLYGPVHSHNVAFNKFVKDENRKFKKNQAKVNKSNAQHQRLINKGKNILYHSVVMQNQIATNRLLTKSEKKEIFNIYK